MQLDQDLFQFMSEHGPEVELMREKMEEVTRATKAQGDRLVGMLADDAELAGLGIGRPRTWQPAGSCGLWCSTYYDVALPGKGQRVHPEVSNVVSAVRLQCWVSNSAAKEAVRGALADAGYEAISEGERHLVLKELPLSTPDEALVEELRGLIHALLPITDR